MPGSPECSAKFIADERAQVDSAGQVARREGRLMAAALLRLHRGAESLRRPARVSGDAIVVDQAMIDIFADVTHDQQWIHVDPARAAAESPFKTTIAHGLLTLSLITGWYHRCFAFPNRKMALNYGFDKVRFTSPVPCGSPPGRQLPAGPGRGHQAGRGALLLDGQGPGRRRRAAGHGRGLADADPLLRKESAMTVLLLERIGATALLTMNRPEASAMRWTWNCAPPSPTPWPKCATTRRCKRRRAHRRGRPFLRRRRRQGAVAGAAASATSSKAASASARSIAGSTSWSTWRSR